MVRPLIKRSACRHPHRLPEGDGSIHVRLGHGSARACGNVRALYTRAVGQRGQLFIGIFGRDVGLSLIGLGNEFPECSVRGLPNAVGVSGAFSAQLCISSGKF